MNNYRLDRNSKGWVLHQKHWAGDYIARKHLFQIVIALVVRWLWGRWRFLKHAQVARWEYILLPWWFARWLFAWVFTQIYYPVHNLLAWFDWNVRPRIGSRHVGSVTWGPALPDPLWCGRCLWAGMNLWAEHGYRDDGTGEDVEGYRACPRCGMDI